MNTGLESGMNLASCVVDGVEAGDSCEVVGAARGRPGRDSASKTPPRPDFLDLGPIWGGFGTAFGSIWHYSRVDSKVRSGPTFLEVAIDSLALPVG